MQDPSPSLEEDRSKFWLTVDKEEHRGLLFEYPDLQSFKEKSNVNIHKLQYNFSGNSHLIYNGSFFYYSSQMKKLVKYDLRSRVSAYLDLSFAKLSSRFLYRVQHNQVDLMADENGLWLVFPAFDNQPLEFGNNTFVLKFDPVSMTVEKIWNVGLDHRSKGDLFIVCGVLYALGSVQETYTNIDVAFDLYQEVNLRISSEPIDFINPFAANYMISYNFRTKKIYAWDKGNLIDYPIKFTDQ